MKYLVASLLIFSISAIALAKNPSKQGPKSAQTDKNSYKQKANVRSEHNFDQSLVQGKYQVGNEGLAVVEDSKEMDDLLGMRFEFKDRLRKQAR